MTTIRWFDINIPLSIDDFSKILKDNSFSKELKDGFILKKITPTEITGKYIEEKKFTREIFDPFGEKQIITAMDYITIDFKFIKNSDKWLLEIYSKPRSLKSFSNKIGKLVGYGFFISSINIDLLALIPLLESEFKQISISKIEIHDININDIALGQLILTGNQDIRKSINNFLINKKDYTVKSIKASIPYSDLYQGVFEISHNTRLEFTQMPNQAFLNAYLPIISKILHNNIC